ncbi:hypothetical protein GMSM_43420 [Geomonas sp. Red276]
MGEKPNCFNGELLLITNGEHLRFTKCFSLVGCGRFEETVRLINADPEITEYRLQTPQTVTIKFIAFEAHVLDESTIEPARFQSKEKKRLCLRKVGKPLPLSRGKKVGKSEF